MEIQQTQTMLPESSQIRTPDTQTAVMQMPDTQTPDTQMPSTQTQQLTEAGRQSFKAITRIALNNWHYIDHKILTLNKSINFFTGHSGSGKSTVIDAMQIVLYANTDGRGFLTKRQRTIRIEACWNTCAA